MHLIDLLEQIVRNTNTNPTRRMGSRSRQNVHGRCGRSPVRRKVEDNALAVSSSFDLDLFDALIVPVLEIGSDRTLLTVRWKATLWPHPPTFSSFCVRI